MTNEPDFETLRRAVAELRQDTAKVMAAMQLGGQRRERREQERRLSACRKRARALAPQVQALLPNAEGDTKERLEKDATFLSQLATEG